MSGATMLDVRLLTYVEGDLLAIWGHLARPVLQAHGVLAARTVRALAAFEHPGLDRVLQWDSRQATHVVEALSPSVADSSRRELAQATAQAAARDLSRLTDDLPQQAIHGDLTDINVLARSDPALARQGERPVAEIAKELGIAAGMSSMTRMRRIRQPLAAAPRTRDGRLRYRMIVGSAGNEAPSMCPDE